jgi:hypothetical protein
MEGYEAQRARFEAEQQKFWTALRDKLEGFKDNCGASIAEMADGLDISRQPLYNFMGEPNKGLSKINRLALLALWAYLTDPEQYKNRKLTDTHREARESLCHEGPDGLLRAAGFLGRDDLDRKAMTIVNPQMKRLVLRLQSKWLYDDALRAYIIDRFLDDLLDQGRPDGEIYLKPLDYKEETQRKEIEDWPFKQLQEGAEYREFDIRRSYLKAIEKLVASGKTKFLKSEIFELYQSIVEHRENRDSDNEVEIDRCEFETLSSTSILDNLGFLKIQINAERRVSFNPSIIDTKSQFPPIVEVKIGCRFLTGGNSGDPQESYFKYASSATHVENMLVAIKQGLCHPLNISGFFIRAVGRTDKSLARVAIALSESNDSKYQKKQKSKIERVDEVYQGWWVTSNTILGILKAYADAFKSWLSEKKDTRSYDYYKACRKLANVNEKFYEVSTAAFEGNFEALPDHDDLKSEIHEAVDDIENAENSDVCLRLEEVKLRLKGKKVRLTLTLLHLYVYEGLIREAKKIFDDRDFMEKEIDLLDDPFKHLLLMSLRAEHMKYKLVTGDQELLLGKLWRNDESYSLAECEKAAKEYVKQSGNINFNCYFFMAEFLNTLGMMEFYSVEKKKEVVSTKRENLEKGYEYLVESAHYSSRIGYERKATQSLLYVVRILSRLRSSNIKQKSKKIIDEAEKVLNRAQSSQDRDWLNAIYYLSRGEHNLLVNEETNDAMRDFLLAYRCSIEIKYMRLVPDCFYNIYRALDLILKSDTKEPGIQLKLKLDNSEEFKDIRQRMWVDYEIAYKNKKSDKLDAAKNLTEHFFDKNFIPNKDNMEQTKNACISAAIWILNDWASIEGYDEHAFSEHIRKGSFLSPLSED